MPFGVYLKIYKKNCSSPLVFRVRITLAPDFEYLLSEFSRPFLLPHQPATTKSLLPWIIHQPFQGRSNVNHWSVHPKVACEPFHFLFNPLALSIQKFGISDTPPWHSRHTSLPLPIQLSGILDATPWHSGYTTLILLPIHYAWLAAILCSSPWYNLAAWDDHLSPSAATSCPIRFIIW